MILFESRHLAFIVTAFVITTFLLGHTFFKDEDPVIVEDLDIIDDSDRRWHAPTRPQGIHQLPGKLSWKERRRSIDAIQKLAEVYPKKWSIESFKPRNTTLNLLLDIAACLESNDCTEKQSTIVIGGTFYYGYATLGSVQGEHIWARSTIDAFSELSTTMLFAQETLEVLDIYTALPPTFVNHIIMSDEQIMRCTRHGVPHRLRYDWLTNPTVEMVEKPSGSPSAVDEGLDLKEWSEKWGWFRLEGYQHQKEGSFCMKRPGFEQGIPIWKMFSFSFWPYANHPLGAKFVLIPEDYSNFPERTDRPDFYYLGYSIEKWCKQHQYYSQEERSNRAFIYGKTLNYFDDSNFLFYNDNHTFEDIHENTGVNFVAAADTQGEEFPDKVVEDLGPMPVNAFYEQVGKSGALIGLGQPYISPTPYDGLCLGVPFINPIHTWDRNYPDDRSRWYTQSQAFHDSYPPYVYHVHAHDLKEYEEAIETAMNTPIDPYIMPKMTTEANVERHGYFLSRHWQQVAKELIEAMPDSERLDYAGKPRYIL